MCYTYIDRIIYEKGVIKEQDGLQSFLAYENYILFVSVRKG